MRWLTLLILLMPAVAWASTVINIPGGGAADPNSINEDELGDPITFAAGDLLDFSAWDNTDGDGLIIPTHATLCTNITTEGQICWDQNDETLYVGDGTGAPTAINASGGTHPIGVGDFDADIIDAEDLTDDLVFEANSLLNLSSTDPANPLAGIYLPQQAGACVGADEEGSICWDSTNDELYVGDGAAPVRICSHDGTIAWSGTSILDHGAAFAYGISDEATITHTYATSGANDPTLTITDDSVAWTNSATFLVEGSQVVLTSDTVAFNVGSTTADGTLIIHDDDAGGDATITIQAPDTLGTGYTLTLPPDDGDNTQVLATNGSGVLDWTAASGTHTGTITWAGTSILDHGTAFSYGISDEATITHIYATSGANDPTLTITDDSVAWTNSAAFLVEGAQVVTDATLTTNLEGAGLDINSATLRVTPNGIDETELATTITFGSTDYLNLSGIDASTTTEGLRLPQIGSACVAATEEGQICWDTVGDNLYVGDGAAAQQMNGAAPSTEVRSMYWGAGSMEVDGTQCAAATAVALVTSGPTPLTIACADNDGGTFSGSTSMPDSWSAGTVIFTLIIGQIGASTNAIEIDFEAQCIGSDEPFLAFAGTGEQPANITLTADDDMLEDDTDAVTVNGTTCAGGDMLIWQGAVDAGNSHADIATTMVIVGVKMEYTSTIGD